MMRFAAALLVLMAPLQAAEAVERIVAAVGTQVVTTGMVRRQLRMSAFVNNREPDYSEASMKEATECLIDQALIRKEIELTKYAPVPVAEAEARIAAFMERRKLTKPELLAGLEKYSFREQDFLDEALWQLTLMQFIEFRFRPSVQVTEFELQEYYTKTYVPRFKAANPKLEPQPLDEVRDRIAQIIASNKSTTTLNQWLQQSRQQVQLRYIEGALR
jgi:hypothetical protein